MKKVTGIVRLIIDYRCSNRNYSNKYLDNEC